MWRKKSCLWHLALPQISQPGWWPGKKGFRNRSLILTSCGYTIDLLLQVCGHAGASGAHALPHVALGCSTAHDVVFLSTTPSLTPPTVPAHTLCSNSATTMLAWVSTVCTFLFFSNALLYPWPIGGWPWQTSLRESIHAWFFYPPPVSSLFHLFCHLGTGSACLPMKRRQIKGLRLNGR